MYKYKFIKRTFSFLLAIVMIGLLSACEENNKTETQETDESYVFDDFPKFVPAKEKFTDTNKKYVLPDGFIYEYVPEEKADFTNRADCSSEDWKFDSRIKHDGTETSAEDLCITNYIPCKSGDTIRIKNADAVYNAEKNGAVNWCYYDENKEIIAVLSPYSDASGKIVYNETGEIESAEIGYIDEEAFEELAYIRITLHFKEDVLPEDVVITVNEEIKYVKGDTYSWEKTEQYVPQDWYDEIKHDSLKIKELYKSEEDTITFVVTSDIHVMSENDRYVGNIGKVSAEVMRRCNIPFFMSLGDLSTQSTGYDISVFDDCMDLVLDILSPIPQKNLILTVGNHDGATGMKETEGYPIYYRHQLNNEQRSEIFFGWQRETNPDKQFGGDGTYYYLDDDNTKTRYIMLNSFWSEWEGDPETGYVEDIQHGFMQSPIYGQEQLSWFANEALDMPRGYSAIIGTHHASSPKDYEMLKNIISAFVNKEKYSGSYTGEQEWQSSFIEVDYSFAKGDIIAIFQGHNHKYNVDMETFEIPCITITTAGAYYAVNDDNPTERIPNSATETAIDVVTIDKEDRIIYLTRIGAGNDRRIEY